MRKKRNNEIITLSQMFSSLNHGINVDILYTVQITRSNENVSGQNDSGVYSSKNLQQNAHFKGKRKMY